MKSSSLCAALVLASLALLGCAAGAGIPKEGRLAEPPAAGPGFMPNTQMGTIVARARFVEDYEKVFGEDLIDDFGVIPIALKLGLKGVGSEHETVYANPAQMEFRLFLEDGTALESVPPAKVAKGEEELEKKLNSLALHEDDLPNFDAAKDKYVFFRLAPRKQFELSGNKLSHQAGDIRRTLVIERSLMSFRINRGGKTLPFHIGLTRGPAQF